MKCCPVLYSNPLMNMVCVECKDNPGEIWHMFNKDKDL